MSDCNNTRIAATLETTCKIFLFEKQKNSDAPSKTPPHADVFVIRPGIPGGNVRSSLTKKLSM